MAYTEESYIGKGKVYLDGRFIGNVPKLTCGANEEVKKLPDYTSPGGGHVNTVRRIKDVTIAFTMNDFSADNLALALRATPAAATVTPVVDAQHIATPNRLIVLEGINPQSVTVTTEGGAITYQAGVHYTVSPAGVTPLEAQDGIADGDTVLISYTPSAGKILEAFVNSGGKHQLVFEGLNEAKSGRPVVVIVHRVSLGVAGTVDWIADDFGALELSGDVEADPIGVAAGKSKFYKVLLANA